MFSTSSAKQMVNYLHDQINYVLKGQPHPDDPQLGAIWQHAKKQEQQRKGLGTGRGGSQRDREGEGNGSDQLEEISFRRPDPMDTSIDEIPNPQPSSNPTQPTQPQPQQLRIQPAPTPTSQPLPLPTTVPSLTSIKNVLKKYLIQPVQTSSQKLREIYNRYSNQYIELDQTLSTPASGLGEACEELDNTVYLQKERLIRDQGEDGDGDGDGDGGFVGGQYEQGEMDGDGEEEYCFNRDQDRKGKGIVAKMDAICDI